MRAEDVLYESADQGESQTVEFKTSLALQAKGIQTMVAFANSQGGWVFFGVTDDGSRKGVQIGTNTLERLAAAIRDHTYPSLPVVIEAIPSRDKRNHIIGVEVPSDVPPVIGAYLYSGDPIPLDSPVRTGNLRAYRRVGRMNQTEDFMRLRQPLPSDPRLRIALPGKQQVHMLAPAPLRGSVWVEEGSATAHKIAFRFDPAVFKIEATIEDLPYPYESQRATPSVGFLAYRRLKLIPDNISGPFPVAAKLVAIFHDDWGLMWESSRRIEVLAHPTSDQHAQVVDAGEFRRRIVEFPPKAQ